METLQKRTLFWDVNPENIDPKKNQRFVIERILSRGDVEDMRWAQEFYGDEALKTTLVSTKIIDRKSFFFWCSYFNVDTQQCTQKPSLLKRDAFWKK